MDTADPVPSEVVADPLASKSQCQHLVQHFGLQMATVKLFSLPSSKFCTAFAELGLGKKVVGAVNGER